MLIQNTFLGADKRSFVKVERRGWQEVVGQSRPQNLNLRHLYVKKHLSIQKKILSILVSISSMVVPIFCLIFHHKWTKKGPILVENYQLWILIFPRWNSYLPFFLLINFFKSKFDKKNIGSPTEQTAFCNYAHKIDNQFFFKS